jgi:hypothetical protein
MPPNTLGHVRHESTSVMSDTFTATGSRVCRKTLRVEGALSVSVISIVYSYICYVKTKVKLIYALSAQSISRSKSIAI